ncbi:hypothetical protein ACA910_016097 [Epithemia clementina (nom. ined.)]
MSDSNHNDGQDGNLTGKATTTKMPAEWSKHDACLILYPHSPFTFRLDKARREVEQLARSMSTVGNERVILYCNNEMDRDELRAQLLSQMPGSSEMDSDNKNLFSNIQLEICPSNDTLARDTAPTFVYREEAASGSSSKAELIGLDWQFNAYGGPEEGVYWPCDLDCQIASVMCRQLSVLCRSVPIVLEGGSIHTDGEGTILTTEECLLNPNRNPTLSKADIEKLVLAELGASKMIWLPDGVAFDSDTNGHIDNWACFVRPGHVVLAWTDNEKNDSMNYERCRRALQILENCTDAQGRNLTVHKLYLPSPVVYTQEEVNGLQSTNEQQEDGSLQKVESRKVGERMAASYINFYIANEAVMVPQFGDEIYDAKAVETLTALFAPERTVVGVPSREILIGGGNIHCITQQFPSRQKL